jgi:hypothetical protein
MKKHLLLLLTIGGSFLTHAQQQLPNPSFENWTTNGDLPYDEPDNWFGTSTVCIAGTPTDPTGPTTCSASSIKTTDAYAGSYAAKLVNLSSPQNGSILEGQLIYSPTTEGYVEFTSKPKSLTGYYKFNKTGTDIINITITITGPISTDLVAFGTLDLKASKTAYTPFTVPLTYMSQTITPKDIYVLIGFNDDASVDSDFTVDNLAFTYASTPTSTTTPVAAGIKFFPNPGKDVIYFEKTVKNISIQSAGGSSVLTSAEDIDELNIGSLDQGVYIISYEHNDMLIHGKLIVE